MMFDKAAKIGLLSVLFLSPFGEMLNPSKTSYTFTVPKLLTLGVMLLWLLGGILSKKSDFIKAPFKSPIFNCLWILILVDLLSLIGAENVGAGVNDLRRLIQLLIFIVILADVFKDEVWFKRAIATILAASVIAMSLGIMEMVTKKSALQLVGKKTYLHTRSATGELVAKKGEAAMPESIGGAGVSIRVQGPNSDPNIFASYLIIIIGLALSRLFASDSIGTKAALTMLVVVAIINIVYTSSRTGIAGAAATLGVFAVLAPYRRKGVVFALIFVLILMSPFIFLNFRALAPDTYRTFHTTGLEEIGRDPRIDAWFTGLKMIRLHPALGVGLGNFMDVYLRYREPTFLQTAQPVQNTFIKIWAEGGTVAMAAFVLFLVFLFKNLFTCLFRSPNRHYRLVAAGITAALVGLVPLHIAQENIWEQEFLWTLFGLTVVICGSLAVPANRPETEPAITARRQK